MGHKRRVFELRCWPHRYSFHRLDGIERGRPTSRPRLALAAIGQTHPDGSTRLNNVDWIIPDPFPELPAAGDPMPGAKGHSNYDADAPFESARSELFTALGVDPASVGAGGHDGPDITITVDQEHIPSIS